MVSAVGNVKLYKTLTTKKNEDCNTLAFTESSIHRKSI